MAPGGVLPSRAADDQGDHSGASAEFILLQWPLQPEHYYRALFVARNGQWRQDLILRRSDAANCWLAATRVFGPSLEERFQHMPTGLEDADEVG